MVNGKVPKIDVVVRKGIETRIESNVNARSGRENATEWAYPNDVEVGAVKDDK